MCSLLLIAVLSQAQSTRSLKSSLQLQMPEGEGSNGAGVVWHPGQKKYYAAFAGNISYPLAVFDATGKRLSDDDLTAGFDARGMWYDAAKKTVCGNAYSDGGLYKLALNTNGIPYSSDNFVKEALQPDENAVGFIVPPLEAVCFLTGQELLIYKVDEAKTEETIRLYVGKKDKSEVKEEGNEFDLYTMPDNYNAVSAVFTEKTKAEFGLLNFTEKQIELYDAQSGLMTQILKLPNEVPVPERFNFAFANGIYWLFDKENRKWVGYK
jgi:hypothetical protein